MKSIFLEELKNRHNKLMGSMDGTNWEFVALSEEGRADILAVSVNLNGAVVTISLILRFGWILILFFLLLQCLASRTRMERGG